MRPFTALAVAIALTVIGPAFAGEPHHAPTGEHHAAKSEGGASHVPDGRERAEEHVVDVVKRPVEQKAEQARLAVAEKAQQARLAVELKAEQARLEDSWKLREEAREILTLMAPVWIERAETRKENFAPCPGSSCSN